MTRHEFLRQLHALANPRTYLEIGVNDGRSLALSRAPSIAVDPAYKIKVKIECDAQLVKATSDDFFARSDPLAHLRGRRGLWQRLRGSSAPSDGTERATPMLDLVFIDGLHLFEFALRDFMNSERLAGWTSLIVLDDVLPRDVDEAARDRHTKMWAGDVYKMGLVLRAHRPDLVVLPMNTHPTGLLVVLGADPANEVLRNRYDALLQEWVRPDPQEVPAEILDRRRAVDPQRFLDSPIIPLLVKHRSDGGAREQGYDELREASLALLPQADMASAIHSGPGR